MNVYERACRIHDYLNTVYWSVRHDEKLKAAWIQMDLDIHEIISDYERRGMSSDGPSS